MFKLMLFFIFFLFADSKSAEKFKDICLEKSNFLEWNKEIDFQVIAKLSGDTGLGDYDFMSNLSDKGCLQEYLTSPLYIGVIESRFKFKGDGINFQIPAKFSYSSGIDEKFKLLKQYDKKIISAQVGIVLDISILSFLKIGLRGGDEKEGYAYSFNQLDQRYDVFNVSAYLKMIFGACTSCCFRISPEVRFGYKNEDPFMKFISNSHMYKFLSLSLPIKIGFELIEDMYLKFQFNPICADWNFMEYRWCIDGKVAKIGAEFAFNIQGFTCSIPFLAYLNVCSIPDYNLSKFKIETKLIGSLCPRIDLDMEIYRGIFLSANMQYCLEKNWHLGTEYTVLDPKVLMEIKKKISKSSTYLEGFWTILDYMFVEYKTKFKWSIGIKYNF